MLKSLQVLLIKPSCDAIVQGSIFYRRLFRNREELEKLSELGVLFLLFEMGLELSLDRLKVQTPETETGHWQEQQACSRRPSSPSIMAL